MKVQNIAEAAGKLLMTAGYMLIGSDDALIIACAAHTEMEILNFCGAAEVPDALTTCAARLCTAEFLKLKKATGTLDGFTGLDLTAAVKSIQEGDTAISYDTTGTASAEKRLDAWISALESCRRQLIAFRRLAW